MFSISTDEMTEARKEPIVFAELDTRQDAGFTVSLEWNRDMPPTGAAMTVAQQLQHQSVVPMESTIPLGMTCDAWRRWRSPRLRRREPLGARLLAAGLRILPIGTRRCCHFQESTSRYDHNQKVLSFLLVCRTCGIETLVHRQPYEPLFEPHPAREFSP
jgi:hypothetical protein